MQFRIPGRQISVRLFERVGTTDSQYNIYDVGLQQADGSIDSVAVGGSFSYVKSLAKKADERAVSEANLDIAEAQAVNDVPVTEPVLQAVPA